MTSAARLPATTLVIFGITGDLSRRKLLPALAQLAAGGHLPKGFKLIGLSRKSIKSSVILDRRTNSLKAKLQLIKMDMADDAAYRHLKHELKNSRRVIFYFAVPPPAVLPITHRLGEAGLNGPRFKLLLEKPFGVDLESARELAAATAKYFREDQIFRIDHFMAKEMAQNIAVFLSANALFRDVWDRRFIESISITASESIGIEGRTGFYESTGALRDLVQSHLMNLAALTLMEPGAGIFDVIDIPRRRLTALRRLKSADRRDVVRGQYRGYRREVGNARSMVETFVSLRLFSEDVRWTGVPITIATGKHLDKKLTEIRVLFKKAEDSQTNTLVLRIQPEEGIEIDLWSKMPGYDRQLHHLPLKSNYGEGLGRLPDAYEQVLVDAMRGSQGLFASGDEVLETWRILQPVLDCWSMDQAELKLYKPGSKIEQVLSQ